MTGIYWAIAIIVFQAIVAGLAKRAQENAKAAKSAGASPATAKPEPRVVAKARPTRPAQQTAKPQSSNARASAAAASRPSKTTSLQQASQRQQAASGRSADSGAAMASRQHLADAVAKVKTMEAKVADASGVHAMHPGVGAREVASTESRRLAADMRQALMNPREVRRAFLLAEILGRPKSAQAI